MNVLPTIILFLTPALFLYIFLYMLGVGMKNRAMRESAKNELWEWGVNVVLAVVFTLLFFQPTPEESFANLAYNTTFTYLSQSSGWAGSYDASKPAWENLLSLFENNVQTLQPVLRDIGEAYDKVGEGNRVLSITTFTSKQLFQKYVSTTSSTSVRPCGAWALLLTPLSQLFGQVGGLLTSFLNLHSFVHQMSSTGAIYLYFVVGFFFRSFRITRGIGGFLIAFALATIFIMPFGYILMEGIFTQVVGSPPAEYVVSKTSALLSAFPVEPGNCNIFTHPSKDVGKDVVNFYNIFYSSDVVAVGYAILLTYAFAWLMFFSGMLGIMNILGGQVSPFILNMLLRV